MMTHFRKRLSDVLAELNEIVAIEGAKEANDEDDHSGSVSGGKRKRSTPCAAATETEFEQQALFEETLAESAAQPSAGEQTVEVSVSPETSELETDETIDSTSAPEQPNQGALLVDTTCAPADGVSDRPESAE